MRVVVRTDIDINKPINLRRLSPLSKILVAFKKQLQYTVFFERRRFQAEQRKNRERIIREDNCKESISTRLYQELVLGKSAEKSDTKIKEVIISINSKYRDIIFDQKDDDGNVVHVGIFKHTDFSQYNIIPIQENMDIRKAFPEMPYLFRCSRKVL